MPRELNRIYIRQEDIARSMYRRKRETAFTTEDVMRLHWNRQGKTATAWAREIIKRMVRAGIVESYTPPIDVVENGDRRRVLYRFTAPTLAQWGLDK